MVVKTINALVTAPTMLAVHRNLQGQIHRMSAGTLRTPVNMVADQCGRLQIMQILQASMLTLCFAEHKETYGKKDVHWSLNSHIYFVLKSFRRLQVHHTRFQIK
jgi:hypothetical protein